MGEHLPNVQVVIPPGCLGFLAGFFFFSPPCYPLPTISQRSIGPCWLHIFFKALINSRRALSWLPLAHKYPDCPPGCLHQFLYWGHLRKNFFLSQVISFSNLQPAAEEGTWLITSRTRAVTMQWGKKFQSAGRVMVFTFLAVIPQTLDAHRPLFPPSFQKVSPNSGNLRYIQKLWCDFFFFSALITGGKKQP